MPAACGRIHDGDRCLRIHSGHVLEHPTCCLEWSVFPRDVDAAIWCPDVQGVFEPLGTGHGVLRAHAHVVFVTRTDIQSEDAASVVAVDDDEVELVWFGVKANSR